MTFLRMIGNAIAILLILQNVNAQNVEQLPWQQRDRPNMQPLEFQYQREADVFWSKNTWRVIDVNEKMNKPFAYPPRPLIQIIHEAALNGSIKVYDPAVENADQFKKVMDTTEVAKIGAKQDTTLMPNAIDPDKLDTVIISENLRWEKVTKYRIKETWFFDTRTSSMQVRIMGIAPVMEFTDSKGHYLGDMVLYWVYFPDLRGILAKQGVFNPQNDWQHISWDDLFAMRMFSSYIYKESNVYDRNIQEYASGTDALLESDRIKQHIFEMEHDLWDY